MFFIVIYPISGTDCSFVVIYPRSGTDCFFVVIYPRSGTDCSFVVIYPSSGTDCSFVVIYPKSGTDFFLLLFILDLVIRFQDFRRLNWLRLRTNLGTDRKEKIAIGQTFRDDLLKSQDQGQSRRRGK